MELRFQRQFHPWHYNRFRYFDPSRGAYASADPLGQLDELIPDPYEYEQTDRIHLYEYANQSPLTRIDALGLSSLAPSASAWSNGVAGFGDTISFGLSGWARRAVAGLLFGDPRDPADKCSDAYGSGEYAGVAWGFAAGGLGGLRAAGTKAAGKEFSHFIPNRYLKSLGGWARKRFGRSRLNGNYVSPWRHYKHDPFRYPPGYAGWGPKWNPVAQLLDRVPRALLGPAAGAGLMAASAGSDDCECPR
jgi:RHS repeat-associated protein